MSTDDRFNRVKRVTYPSTAPSKRSIIYIDDENDRINENSIALIKVQPSFA